MFSERGINEYRQGHCHLSIQSYTYTNCLLLFSLPFSSKPQYRHSLPVLEHSLYATF
jgi:hypothetical protein